MVTGFLAGLLNFLATEAVLTSDTNSHAVFRVAVIAVIVSAVIAVAAFILSRHSKNKK